MLKKISLSSYLLGVFTTMIIFAIILVSMGIYYTKSGISVTIGVKDIPAVIKEEVVSIVEYQLPLYINELKADNLLSNSLMAVSEYLPITVVACLALLLSGSMTWAIPPTFAFASYTQTPTQDPRPVVFKVSGDLDTLNSAIPTLITLLSLSIFHTEVTHELFKGLDFWNEEKISRYILTPMSKRSFNK